MAFERTILGRTGLSVSRLGIGSSYGTDQSMLEAAAERGVNYFYWGARRTGKMAKGIRHLAKTKRDDMVVVAHTGSQRGYRLPALVHKCLKRLGLDYIDVLLLAWHNSMPNPRLVEAALKLKREGMVNFLALSGHNRLLFPQLVHSAGIDIFHIRYNAAHRGAESEIFENLPESGGPGIVTFTTTRWGGLLRPQNMPPGENPPTPRDCYRFVLSHNSVHVAACAPNSMAQLNEDLLALEEGPMNAEELERMRRIGDHVHYNVSGMKDQLKGMGSIKW